MTSEEVGTLTMNYLKMVIHVRVYLIVWPVPVNFNSAYMLHNCAGKYTMSFIQLNCLFV